MSEPNASSPATRAAHVAAFGMLYALCAGIARTVLARPIGVAPDLAYYAGAAVALPFDMLLGALLAWPIGRKPAAFGARLVSGVLAILLLALHVAVTPRLPGAVSRAQLELSGLQALGAGLMLGAGLLALVTPLAARLEKRYATRAGRVADAVALGLLACLSIGASVGAYDDLYAGAVHPAWHLALEPEGRETPAADPVQEERHAGHEHEGEHEHEHGDRPQTRYSPGDRMVLHDDPPSTDGRPPGDVRVMTAVLHQGDALEPVPDTAYPLCVERARTNLPPGEAAPSIIVLLLRDVGMRELEVNQANGAPVMPLLRRLSEEAVLFDDVMAAGETDEDVLLAVLSGQPPSPETPVMADPALPYLPGVARDLRDVGYETAFFDGSRDLRTYRQTYLRMAGFTTLDVPPLGGPARRTDEETYAHLQSWLASQPAGRSRFAVMHGLGRSADQLALGTTPDDMDTLRARLAYADAQLEAFYTWYAENERPRGTVLLVMGDHPSPVEFPGDPETPTTVDGHELHFRVPLFVTGVPAAQERALRERSSRLGAQTDLPRTLLGLARDTRIGCYFGRDLFADGEWPVRRAPLSFGGDSRQFLVAHDGDIRWLYNTLTRGVRIHDRAADPRFERDLFSEDDPELPRMREYLLSYLATQRYLRRHRRYMPVPELPEGERRTRTQPLRINDRGLLAGPPAAGAEPLRQSHPEVEAAAAAGFETITLDLQMTTERALVTIGATELLQLGNGINVNVEDVTRQQLETLRRPAPTVQELLQQHPQMSFVFHVHTPARPELREAWFHTLVTTFRELPAERVTLATYDPVIAGLLVGALREAGVDIALVEAPEGVEGGLAWLQTARAIGVPWLYLPPTAVSTELLETAQRWGVRVGLTGVTGPGAVLRLMAGGVAPDAYLASRAFLLDRPTPRVPAAP
ncbi:MAG: sulfatase-like hydrolase/transferase [Sandaracinaceae bacterium]|jgi:hypothetical protein|nr:sulfatase-like hydrolase/transferase [Sandaracinaceae bacterium]MBP7683542.1 sulfatase-like hydrolase/transferase [Deltaproteobacteria bacterium]MBK6809733.1 sulfatase-like hydrolase/transferase [Sandaracinaceae bacterium]MBK7777992.1 sulfatase-like hydrolase/transferase [Sandaracinaceae bacterium]MBK8412254.1 sulfatase-like hydrolase/transferase [Sandaracinaceae bacterium]